MALSPGFSKRLGSKSMPSFCLYSHTNCALSVGVTTQAGYPGGFLLYYQPGVDIIGEESLFASIGWDVVDFVDFDESVSQFHSLLDLGDAPFPSERSLFGQRHDFSRKGFVISSSIHAWQRGKVSFPLGLCGRTGWYSSWGRGWGVGAECPL